MPSGAELQSSPFIVPRSGLPGVAWPAIANDAGALLLAMQWQLEASERFPPKVILECQHGQVAQLAEHAYEHSAFWRARLSRAGYHRGSGAPPPGSTPRWFAALPALTRADVQSAGRALFSDSVPLGHGNVHTKRTTGSTATPIFCSTTDAAMVFWQAITLRDALWHGRDLSAKLAAIRVGSGRETHPDWGPAYGAYASGPGVNFDARESVDAQIEWLMEQRPQYLLSHASNLRALALRCIERGIGLDSLREARSYSERLPEDLRELARKAWGVKLTDMYSASEVGYIALQCPVSGRYHVQSEDVLVEVVDDGGQPCAPGAIGRVLVTSLHNFAMPLLRYDIGDYAEAGAPCACGRTLPVLERIMGRTRNMMRLPGGGTSWPGFPVPALVKVPAIRQFRMIQHSLTEIEAELVLDRPLSAQEETELRAAILARLRHPFEVRFTRVERIEWKGGYKMEDFECRVV